MSNLRRLLAVWLPLLAWSAAIYVVSGQSRLPQVTTDRLQEIVSVLAHVLEYAILAWLVLRVLRINNWGEPRSRVVITLLFCLVYALSDEWHQSFVPGRTPDVLDVLADTTGTAMSLVLLRQPFFRDLSKRFDRILLSEEPNTKA